MSKHFSQAQSYCPFAVSIVKVTVVSNSLWLHGHYSPGTLQARILEWVAIPFSRGPSWPRSRTGISHVAGRFFTSWTTREALSLRKSIAKCVMLSLIVFSLSRGNLIESKVFCPKILTHFENLFFCMFCKSLSMKERLNNRKIKIAGSYKRSVTLPHFFLL